MEVFLKNIHDFDLFLSESFFNHCKKNPHKTLNDAIKIKKRILHNRFYLKQMNDFLNEDDSREILKELHQYFHKWFSSMKKKKFHKNASFKNDFMQFDNINTAINENLKQMNLNIEYNDIFLNKLILLYFFRFKTIKIDALIHNCQLNLELKNTTDTTIDCYYSRNTFCQFIVDDLEKWLLIFCNTCSTTLQISNIINLLGHFLLFLEHKQFIKTHTKVKLIDGKKIQLFYHQLNCKEVFIEKNSPLIKLIFIRLIIAKEEPLIYLNSFFYSEKFYKGAAIQLNDYIYENYLVIQPNKSYGFLRGENISYDEKSSNIHYEKLRIKKIIKKSSIKINFFKNESNPLKKIIKKENSTKIYSNWKNFEEIKIQFWKKNISHLKNINLNDIKPDTILNLLLSYSFIESNINMNMFMSLLLAMNLTYFEEIFKEREYFYLLSKHDGRGRKYYYSAISPTNFKLSRFFMQFGSYTTDELSCVIKNSLNSKSFEILNSLNLQKDILKLNIHNSWYSSFLNSSNCELQKKIENKIKINDIISYKNYIACHFLIAIGVLYKSKMLKNPKICKDGYSLDTRDFFEQGQLEYNKYLSNSKYLESIHDDEDYFKLKFYLDGLKNGVDWFLRTNVGMDFSCSGHQLRYLYHGFDNMKSCKFINLDGRTSYVDMYSLILSLYKNKVKEDFENSKTKDQVFRKELLKNFQNFEEIEELWTFINRKTLKKSLMTGEYNATFFRFLNYFEKEIKKESFEKFKSKFIILLKGLYNFSKNLGSTDQLKTQEESQNLNDLLITKIKAENYQLTMWDGFQIGFAVFKKHQGDVRIYYTEKENNKIYRATFQLKLYSDEIDKKKTEISILPNFIHGLDANIVRLVCYYSKMPYCYISVHDEYWLPFQEVFIFKDLINQVLKLDFFVAPSLSDNDEIDIKNHPLSSKKFNKFFCYNIIV